ncbi:MAG TPA: hypothetical protein VEA58_04285 [Anaerovoracaceae bacterium]|nr:hypothetical protein [Anaerovoracaceae bacterium]
MNENINFVWLAIGIIPYHFEKKWVTPFCLTFIIKALFWKLELKYHIMFRHGRQVRKQTEWAFDILIIERLKEAIWTTIAKIHKE